MVKELLDLRLYALAAVLALAGTNLQVLTTVDWSRDFVLGLRDLQLNWALPLAVICFLAGQHLLQADFTDRTIGFLDALPLTRTDIFGAKLGVGLTFTAALSLGYSLTLAIALLLPAGDWPLLLAIELVGINFLVFCFLYLLGTATSAVTGLGPLLLASLLLLLFVLNLVSPTARRFIEPFVLIEPEQSPPIEAFGALVGLCLSLAAASYWVFVRRSITETPGLLFKKVEVPRGRVGGIASMVALGVATTLALSSIHRFARSRPGERLVVHQQPPAAYFEKDEALARPLLKSFDDLDARVGALFPGVRRPEVQLELFPAGPFHAGYFAETNIRVGLDRQREITLAHELAHAYTFGLTGRLDPTTKEHVLFFLEGVATWAAAEVTEDPPSLDFVHSWAGAIARQDRGHFDELFYFDTWGEEQDAFEAYPLGTLFVEALIKTHGSEAMRCVLRELASPPFLEGGRLLWEDLSSRCDWDLASLQEPYEALWRHHRKSWVDPYFSSTEPQLWGQLSSRGRLRSLGVSGPFVRSPRLVCRFRKYEQKVIGDLDERTGDLCFQTPVVNVGDTFFYQLGYVLPEGPRVFFPWRRFDLEGRRCSRLSCLDLEATQERSWAAPDPNPKPSPPELQWSHGAAIDVATFSPNGALVATGSGDGDVRLWDAKTWTLLASFRHDHPARQLAFSPDSTRLAVGEHRVRIWSTLDKQLIASTGRFHSNALVFFTEGVVAGFMGDKVNLYDASSGSNLIGLDIPYKVTGLAGREGRLLVLGDGRASWVTAKGMKPVEDVLLRHLRGAKHVCFSRDGRRLGVASDETLRIVDLRTGDLVADSSLTRIRSVAFSPDGADLYYTQAYFLGRLSAQTQHLTEVYKGIFDGWALSPTGQAWAFDDNVVTEVTLPEPKAHRLGLRPKALRLFPSAEPDQFLVEVGDSDIFGPGLEVWSVDGRRKSAIYPKRASEWHPGPAGRLGIIDDYDNVLYLYNLSTGTPRAQWPVGEDAECRIRPSTTPPQVHCLEEVDGALSLKVLLEGRLDPWTVELRPKGVGEDYSSIRHFQFSPDGDRFLVAFGNKTAVWQTPALETAGPVESMAFTKLFPSVVLFLPDSDDLIIASFDGIYTWLPGDKPSLLAEVSDAEAITLGPKRESFYVGTELGALLEISREGHVKHHGFAHHSEIKDVIATGSGHVVLLGTDKSIVVKDLGAGSASRIVPLYAEDPAEPFSATWRMSSGGETLHRGRTRVPQRYLPATDPVGREPAP